MGMVHGHLVVLWLDRELAARVNEAPSVVDALTAAVASAVAKVSGNALAELKILGRAAGPARATPYRGRFYASHSAGTAPREWTRVPGKCV